VLDKAHYSAFQSTLNSPIVSYRIEMWFHMVSNSHFIELSFRTISLSWKRQNRKSVP